MYGVPSGEIIDFIIRGFLLMLRSLSILDAFTGVLGNREKGIYFWGTREQTSPFEGNRRTKTLLGNREHKNGVFMLKNMGTSQFISGEQGISTNLTQET